MTVTLARMPCLVLFRDDVARPAAVFGPRLLAPLRRLTSARSSGLSLFALGFMESPPDGVDWLSPRGARIPIRFNMAVSCYGSHRKSGDSRRHELNIAIVRHAWVAPPLWPISLA